jgi:hypothetical protein
MFCAVAARTKAFAGKAAQAEVRFAQTVTQRSRAGLNCVAPTALSAGQFGGRENLETKAETQRKPSQG